MALTQSEAEVCRLWDRGYSKQRIARETDIPPAVIERAINWCGNDRQRLDNMGMIDGSTRLLAAMQRETAAPR